MGVHNRESFGRRVAPFVVTLILSLAASAAQAKAAAENGIEMAYDNSLVITSASQAREIWLNSDGSYREFKADLTPQGQLSASGFVGTYAVETGSSGARLCLTSALHAGPARQGADCLPVQFGFASKWRVPTAMKQDAVASWRKGRGRDLPLR